MEWLILLVAALVLGQCLGNTEKLFAKFAPPSSNLRRMDGFYELPRTRSEAEHDGWACAEDGLNSVGYAIFCRRHDYRVCLLFDGQGSVAGMQIAFSMKDIEKSATPYPVDLIPFQEKKKILGVDVYAATVFFVDEDTLKSGGRVLTKETKTAPNGMYLPLRDGECRYIPANAKDLEPLFRKQSCKPGMGRHYFYNMSESFDCAGWETFAPMYDEGTGELVSMAYFMFGRSSYQHPGRHWFEETDGAGLKDVIPDSPECLRMWADTYGMEVFHIYVHNEPWALSCP